MSTTTKICPCGHTQHNPKVITKPDYSLMGWFYLSTGISTSPKKVSWICSICQFVFEEITDKEKLKQYK